MHNCVACVWRSMGQVWGARRGVRLFRRHCCTREARVPRSRRSHARETWRARGGRLITARTSHPPLWPQPNARASCVSCANSDRWERMRCGARGHSTHDTRDQIIRQQIIDRGCITTGEASDSRRCIRTLLLLMNIVHEQCSMCSLSAHRFSTFHARTPKCMCDLSSIGGVYGILVYWSSAQSQFWFGHGEQLAFSRCKL